MGTIIPLWEKDPPDARGSSESDIPSLEVLPAAPGKKKLPAMVICPGGGYEFLADHEGKDYALWLNTLGVTCFVLKYRLGSAGYRHPVMLNDAARAVRLVRSGKDRWSLDPSRIGIMGSSAGGHLASTLMTRFDPGNPASTDPVERESSRPDLGILCYPVISMGRDAHVGSMKNLLGDNPPEGLKLALSNQHQVTAKTPPCFIWHTAADTVVPPSHSLAFVSALRDAGVEVEFHLYKEGGHGMGLGKPISIVPEPSEPGSEPPVFHPWTDSCAEWLSAIGFLN